jgi:hypothetical protein
MIFLWVLTWYSYWIFMKRQITPINIFGAVLSAGLLVFSQFSPVRDAVSKTLKLVVLQISKNSHFTHTALGSQNNIKIQIPPVSSTTRIQNRCSKQVEKSPRSTPKIKTQKPDVESIQQITVLKSQKLEPESPLQTTVSETQKIEPEIIKLADKPQPLPSKSNGCPKNLDYYTKKPRPKQTPEECITCKNLITCVCLTSN